MHKLIFSKQKDWQVYNENNLDARQATEKGSFFMNILGSKSTVEPTGKPLSDEDEKRISELKGKLDSFLSAECVNCGQNMIDAIYLPFDTDNTKKAKWEL